jgi:protein arginine kinase activator
MAEGKKCYFCGKPATVHFTQIINNKILKMDLCEECAKKYGIGGPPNFSLSELLSKTSLFDEEPEQVDTCPHCGFSISDAHFKKSGLLGCPHCYEFFGQSLAPILKDLHQGAHHIGKSPQEHAPQRNIKEEIAELERQMQEAIKKEAYEQAAALRDQIAELKAQDKPSEDDDR